MEIRKSLNYWLEGTSGVCLTYSLSLTALVLSLLFLTDVRNAPKHS